MDLPLLGNRHSFLLPRGWGGAVATGGIIAFLRCLVSLLIYQSPVPQYCNSLNRAPRIFDDRGLSIGRGLLRNEGKEDAGVQEWVS